MTNPDDEPAWLAPFRVLYPKPPAEPEPTPEDEQDEPTP